MKPYHVTDGRTVDSSFETFEEALSYLQALPHYAQLTNVEECDLDYDGLTEHEREIIQDAGT